MTFEVPALAAGFASKFDEVGPYIGFGSLVAVVAMAVLVFAQGRELQRLREWAGTSPERLDALEQELQQATANGNGRLAVPARPGYVAPTATVAAVGAPPRPPGAPPAVPGTPGAPPPPGAPPAPGAAPAAPGSPVVGTGAATPPGVPANSGPTRPVPPRPTPPGGAPTRVVPAASSLGGPRAATAAGAAATARERERESGGPQRSVWQIVGVSVVGLVVLLALLFAFGVIGGDSNDPNDPVANTSTGGATAPAKPAVNTYPATEMTTIVLNASGSDGLAGDVSDGIDQKLRFPTGPPADYSVNGARAFEPVTLVQYRTGTGRQTSQNRRAATDLANYLRKTVPGVRVQKMTDNVAVNAQNQRLVVVVGRDYAAKVRPNGTTTSGGSTGTSGTTTGTGGTAGTTGGTAGTSGTTGGATSTTTPGAAAAPATGVDGTALDGTGGTGDTGGTTVP